MWFRFPPGAEAINVQRQTFRSEHAEGGHNFFRAPPHFAPQILQLAGFAALDPLAPPGDLAPEPNPERDTVLSNLGAQIHALQGQVSDLQSGSIAANSKLVAMTAERDKLLAEISKLKGQLAAAKPDEGLIAPDEDEDEDGGPVTLDVPQQSLRRVK